MITRNILYRALIKWFFIRKLFEVIQTETQVADLYNVTDEYL
jgi:hypothetical protein